VAFNDAQDMLKNMEAVQSSCWWLKIKCGVIKVSSWSSFIY